MMHCANGVIGVACLVACCFNVTVHAPWWLITWALVAGVGNILIAIR